MKDLTSSDEMVQANSEKENEDASPKINAFQFMMNSRHRSIGRNSPGRELDLNASDQLSKKELEVRKRRLESWADQKGASKRKREYEEVGNCITYKIEQRGKKLKKMLKVECQSDDEIITKRKRCVVIETDSENSNDAVIQISDEEQKISPKGKKKKLKRNRLSLKKSNKKKEELVSDELLKLSPKSIKSWRFKIKLSMDENSDGEKNETKPENDLTVVNEDKIEVNFTAENGMLAKSEHTTSENERVGTLVANKDTLYNCKREEISGTEMKIENKDENITAENGTSHKLQPTDNETSEECFLLDDGNNDNLNENKRVLRTRRAKSKNYNDYYLSDSDEGTDKKKSTCKKEKKNIKVAPVFLKAIPKPKLDPKIIEARRQFLLSGMPSSLKKEMERQYCNEEVDFDVFPTISHVQQKTPNIFWNLPKVEIDLNREESVKIETEYFTEGFINLHSGDSVKHRSEEMSVPRKIQNCKKIIKEIKSQNPDYPVYKVFNSVYTKCGYKTEKSEEKIKVVPKRRGRPRKSTQSTKPRELLPLKADDNFPHAMWTEKYRARTSLEIIGNHGSIALLKEWLTNWSNIGKDLKKRRNSDSESDFYIDSDSRDSMKIYRNSVILRGPSGCGKTAAVYAVCNELGFNVIEVNASSKRTGKRLLQELQEATQSHQVREKDNILSSFIREKEEKPSKPRICVLLVEDIDIIFEQDEGFTAALSQILTTSKRPIILTTTDEPSSSVQRIISDYQLISFSPLSSILTIWLQIVCLVEGYYVKTKSLEELLSYYEGDIRRTLLQLQLYVNSGGCPSQHEAKNEINTEIQTENDFKIEDDNSNLSDLKFEEPVDSKGGDLIHDNCLSICQVVKKYNSFSLPRNDLGVIWWNLPTLLNLPNFANIRLERTGKTNIDSVTQTEKEKMKMLSECYEALAFTDVMCDQNQFHESLERRWRTKVKDSLVLEEKMEAYIDSEFSNELAHTLISGRIKLYRDKYEDNECKINMSVPVSVERKWRSKQLSSEEKFHEAFTHLDFLGRKSVVLDFIPCLRTMARSERERASHNTKRGNRFYSYFRHLGVHASEITYKNVCDVFRSWDEV